MKLYLWLGALTAVLMLSLSSCTTVNAHIAPNSPTEIYFQRAQQASDLYDYSTSLKIYKELLDRKDLDMATRVSAMYEVAFLHFKMGDKIVAKQLFQKILDLYNDPTQSNLPLWVQILSKKIMKEIN